LKDSNTLWIIDLDHVVSEREACMDFENGNKRKEITTDTPYGVILLKENYLIVT
jgi:hypothetical protein